MVSKNTPPKAQVSLDQLLDAMNQLTDELAARAPEDLSFRVSVRSDVPQVGAMGDLINQINLDWEEKIRREEVRNNNRSKELSHAYEALQTKNDEIQRDLEAARRIQLQLLPQAEDLPQREEVEFAGFYRSKDKVGGDLYDFIRIGKNSWGFLVADVSGHGVPSALLTMFLKAAFRTRARWGAGTDQICREVNTVLSPVISNQGLFVTAFFGILDLETAVFRYTNCGHPPVLLYRESSGQCMQLDTNGMILGPFDDIDLEQCELVLEEGDMLLGFTDGIPESKNFMDEMYGEARLQAAFTRVFAANARQTPSAKVAVDAVRRDFEMFGLGASPDDDMTLAAFLFRNKALEKGLINAVSDVQEDKSRRRRLLVSQLRREAREAERTKNFPLAETLLKSLIALDSRTSHDLAHLALVCFRSGRRSEAAALANQVIEQVEEGTALARLAHSILARCHRQP